MTADPELDRTANVLGALALVVSDHTAAAVVEASGQSLSGAAALSALHEFLDGPTIDDLARVLGLTSSGAVRLVDRLVTEGMVQRGEGTDRRSRSVRLTRKGRTAAARIATARARVLGEVLQRLTTSQLEAAGRSVDVLLGAVVAGKVGGAWTCRLCDLGACQRPAERCPAAVAAAAKYGGSPDAPGSPRAD
jgi:DNA-binding MarR family transcriptional regulator